MPSKKKHSKKTKSANKKKPVKGSLPNSGGVSVTKISNFGTSEPIVARLALGLMFLVEKAAVDDVLKNTIKEICLNVSTQLSDAKKLIGQVTRAKKEDPDNCARIDKLTSLFSERMTAVLSYIRDLQKTIGPDQCLGELANHLSSQLQSVGRCSDQDLSDIITAAFLGIENATITFIQPRLDQNLVLVEVPENKRNPAAPKRFELYVNNKLPPAFARQVARTLGVKILGTPESHSMGKEIIHTQFQGRTLITVGSTIYHSSDWKTFPDFLNDYLKFCFGEQFWRQEVEKAPAKRHPILKIALAKSESEKTLFKKEPDGLLYVDAPTGPIMSYLSLAYDLYTLNHHSALQKRIIQRLSIPDHNFDGARFELVVAATFIRAGFDITPFKEDGKAGSQPEFEAIDRKSGQKLLVEAKRRERQSSAFDENWETSINLGIKGLFQSALNKPHENTPLAIFVDLNVPPIQYSLMRSPLFAQIQHLLDSDFCRNELGKQRYSLAAFLNYPVQYTPKSSPQMQYLISQALNPEIAITSDICIRKLMGALDQYGRIPNWFNEPT